MQGFSARILFHIGERCRNLKSLISTLLFARFFNEYAKNGINFWATSSQNEPSAGEVGARDWPTLLFKAEAERCATVVINERKEK